MSAVARLRHGAVALLGLLLMALPARAHHCGDSQIDIEVGQIGAFFITADVAESQPSFYQLTTPANAGLPVTPASQFQLNYAVFTFLGVTAGSYDLGFTWSYPPNNASATCLVHVVVHPAGSLPPQDLTDALNGFTLEIGDPVSSLTRELLVEEPPDLYLGGPMPLFFRRRYASNLAATSLLRPSVGNNWMHDFEMRVARLGTRADVLLPGGDVAAFTKSFGAWSLLGPDDVPWQLHEDGMDLVLFSPRSQRRYRFDAAGHLTSISDGKGNAHVLAYDGQNLVSVSDGLGRTLTFAYVGLQQIASVSDGTRTVRFAQDFFDNLTSVTDARGNVTTYAYANSPRDGLLTSARRPEGNVPWRQAYGADGRVVSQTDALGNVWTYAAADGGLTAVVTDPLGKIAVYSHDATGALGSVTDAEALSCSADADASGRVASLTDRTGGTTTWGYDAASGKLASQQAADGGVTSWDMATRATPDGFTARDLQQVAHADGSDESFAVDAAGNVTSWTARSGVAATYDHDARGLVTEATNLLGGTTTSTYNADGTRASLVDPFGATTTFAYDALRRLTRITHPDATFRSYAYDLADNLVSMTDELGQATSFSYDRNDRLVRIEDPAGAVTVLEYDGMDRLVRITGPTGDVVTRAFDAAGRPVVTTGPTGATVVLERDERGLVTAVTDESGGRWERTHDAEGGLASVTDPLGNATRFVNDAMGRPVEATTALGTSRSIAYDAMGRLESITNGLGGKTSLAYGASGGTSGVTLPDGTSITVERDAQGNLSKLIDPNGNAWTRTRDAHGRLASMGDPLGGVTQFEHDAQGRLSRVTHPGPPGGTAEYAYDAAGRLVRTEWSDGTVVDATFDAAGRPLTITGVTLAWDAAGRITESNGLVMTRGARGVLRTLDLAPGRTITYEHDDAGHLLSIIDWLGGITTFTRDARGLVATVTRPNGVVTTYEHDEDARLVAIEESSLSSVRLTRDAEGRVTAASRSLPAEGSVASLALRQFDHDAAARVEGYSWDAMGRRLSDDRRSYDWDLASRLRSVRGAAGTVEYERDGMGNPTARTQDGRRREWVWNYGTALSSLAVEREDGRDVTYNVTTPAGFLLYSVDAETGARLFHHFDERGNTVFLTDDAGAVAGTAACGPHGEPLAASGAATRFGWQGRFFVIDEGDGLYLQRARAYDALTASFLSRDPQPTAGPRTANPYQYALGDPMSWIDPRGTSPRPLRGGEFPGGPAAAPPGPAAPPEGVRGTDQAPLGPAGPQAATGDGDDPRDAGTCRPAGGKTVLIFVQYDDANTATFERQAAYFREALIARGYHPLTFSAQQISDRLVGGTDTGISGAVLRDTVGVITIGHSSDNAAAGFNETALEELFKQTAPIEFLALWGCKSGQFYEANEKRLNPYLTKNAAVFGFKTWEVGVKFTGFGLRLSPFDDPFVDFLDGDLPGGYLYETVDPLGWIFGDFLMETVLG